MGISDCRRKGKATKEIHSNFMMTWSGVDQGQRATLGMGFILDPDIAKNLIDTKYVSERIIKIQVTVGQRFANYLQVYAPCNDTYTEEKRRKNSLTC